MKSAGTNGEKEIPKKGISKRFIHIPANCVGWSFGLTEMQKENTARGHVIWRHTRKDVRIVNDFEKYLNALALLESWRNKGVISIADFNKAERHISRKYCIKKGSIYRPNDLIISDF